MSDRYTVIHPDTLAAMRRAGHVAKLEARIEKLEAALLDVEVWISAPPTAYSIMALDGLFSITRERIRKALEGKDD